MRTGDRPGIMESMAKEPDLSIIIAKHKRLLIAVVAFLLLWWAAAKVLTLYADYLWFDSLTYGSVFTTELWAKVTLGVCTFLITALWLAGHVVLATQLSPTHGFQIKGLPWVLSGQKIRRVLHLAAVVFGVVVGFGFAQGAAAHWYEVLQFLDRAPFGWSDPVLGHDAQVYVFVLPILGQLKAYVIAMAVFGAIGAAATYFISGAIGWQYARITRAATTHLAALVAMLLIAVALGYWLDRYDLLLSSRGTVFGAGYVDVHVRLPVFAFMAGASVVAAVVVLAAGIRMKPKVAGVAVGLLVAVHFIAVWSYPTFQQRFDVDPNELEREMPYLEHNIKATRFAFGLADVDVREFPAGGSLTPEAVQAERGTVDNIRLWDWRALKPTYQEIQGLRTYYRFNGVDIDRYHVGGEYRQVSLAVRELEQTLLQEKSRTWVNLHLQYTHGYGLCMSPVNAVTESGMPELWIRDIPPHATGPLAEPNQEVMPNPAVYFGESTQNYVFVRTDEKEFDYPGKDKNFYTRYKGRAGVALNSWARRLLFAYYFGDWNILLTDSFTPETRVLWARRVHARVRRLAGRFLQLDQDAYPVISNGRLVWVIDAYTRTDRFPYSAPAGSARVRTNYIRNAVKVAVDAYDGSVTFYVADPKDAVVQVARRIFPDLFRDLSEMPESLRAHLRYPIDLLDIQAGQYLTYHMTDPRVFYNREDLWQRPSEQYGGQTLSVKAYYIIMTLPGETEPEYLLMLPFTPRGKDNMVGWMAGRCDGEQYGKLLVYQFPKDRLVLGPRQIEANIDKNDAISQQITLWGQKGSRVIRGNLLVIPIRDAVLYVEPLYLDSEQTRFPELKRVIVASKDRVAMRETLDEALAAVFGAAPTPGKPTTPPPDTVAPSAQGKRAHELFEKAQQQLRQGDWAAYGKTMQELGRLLQDMAGELSEK